MATGWREDVETEAEDKSEEKLYKTGINRSTDWLNIKDKTITTKRRSRVCLFVWVCLGGNRAEKERKTLRTENRKYKIFKI